MTPSKYRLLTAAALLGIVAVPHAALAQDGPPPLPPTFSIGAGGPMLVMGGNSLLPLLKRGDVQNGISLTLKQKNELADLLVGNKPVQITARVESATPLSEEERNKKIREQIEAQLNGPEEKIKAILKPEQYDRLVQIQYQWKGLLLLMNQKVSERMKITPDHRSEIMKINAEYQKVKQEVMMSLMQQSNDGSPDGSRRATRIQINAQELDKPLSPAYKKLDAAKTEAEKKILDVLSDEEKANWKAALGAQFTFRTDLPGNRF